MTACYWAPLSLPKHRAHTNNLCWMFVFYNIFIFFFFFNFYCSHLMENQIGNIERGAFDDLKELERLWEHTHTHTHIHTHTQYKHRESTDDNCDIYTFSDPTCFYSPSRLNKNRLGQLQELLFQKNEALSRLWVHKSCTLNLICSLNLTPAPSVAPFLKWAQILELVPFEDYWNLCIFHRTSPRFHQFCVEDL